MTTEVTYHDKMVAAGLRAAEVRWGPRRHIHIGDLPPSKREIVLKCIEAQRHALVDAAKQDAPTSSRVEASTPEVGDAIPTPTD